MKQLIFFRSWLVVVFFMLSAARTLSARAITDMSNRRVVVPDKITRVYVMSPTVEYMMAAIDPSLLVGRVWRLGDSQARYYPKSYQNLPVVGGAQGGKMTISPEMIVALKPDVILIRGDDAAYRDFGPLYSLGIPLIAVDVSSVTRYADSFDFMGRLLNREKRASALSSYLRVSLAEVKSAVSKAPAAKRRTVYWAGGPDGLTTYCATTPNMELIPMAGGVNPVKCVSKGFTGFESVSLEQLVAMNPQVIFASDSVFVASVLHDSRWSDIQAVKNKRVYKTPSGPLSWMGLPSSYMQALGAQWMAQTLYPEYYKKDMRKETQKFMQLFFGVQASQEEISKMLEGKNSAAPRGRSSSR